MDEFPDKIWLIPGTGEDGSHTWADDPITEGLGLPMEYVRADRVAEIGAILHEAYGALLMSPVQKPKLLRKIYIILGFVDPIDDRNRRCTTHHYACNCREQRFSLMNSALAKAVANYGRPGGPWNVPSEPGSWIEMAKNALGDL